MNPHAYPMPPSIDEAMRLLMQNDLAGLHDCLMRGARIDNLASNKSTLLCMAAMREDIRAVQMLLNMNASVRKTDYDGASPLIRAARVAARGDHASLAIVRLLLEAKADPFFRGEDGRSAYDIAQQGANDGLRSLMRLKEEDAAKKRQAADEALERRLQRKRAGLGPLI